MLRRLQNSYVHRTRNFYSNIMQEILKDRATVDYLVVAGGGGGAEEILGGAGGAGGYRESSGAASPSYTASPSGARVSALPASDNRLSNYSRCRRSWSYMAQPGTGSTGSNSVFSTITSTAGGGGGARGCTW
jgi:hypothetical protein